MKFAKIDTILTFSIYIIGLLYSFYRVFLISGPKLNKYVYLGQGWVIFGRKKDDADFEWFINKDFTQTSALFIVTHLVLFELLRLLKFKRLSLAFTIFGSTAITHLYGYKVLLFFIAKNLLYFILSFKKRKSIIWILSIGLIFGHNLQRTYFNTPVNDFFGISPLQTAELGIILFWNILKCISFTIDKMEAKDDDKEFYSFIDFLGYSFYFPTFLYGPIYLYERFRDMLKSSSSANFLVRTKKLTICLILCLLCAIMHEIGQHFLYVNIIPMDLKVMRTTDLWAFYGLGYLMGQFFNNKYIVFYGFSIALGHFDGIFMPRKPICIGRVHLYSDMWKRFDEGLYHFLFKYIYTRVTTRKSSMAFKILGSAVTFAFIYVWHGLHLFVFVWTVLNWCCIVAEGLLVAFMQSKLMHNIIGGWSDANKSRFNALFGTNILILSILSNFFFFAREDAGFIYLRRTYTESLYNYLYLYPFVYCWYRSGEWVKNMEQKQMHKNDLKSD